MYTITDAILIFPFSALGALSVNQHLPLQNPLSACYDSVVDERTLTELKSGFRLVTHSVRSRFIHREMSRKLGDYVSRWFVVCT
jgi:hypothetical protein